MIDRTCREHLFRDRLLFALSPRGDPIDQVISIRQRFHQMLLGELNKFLIYVERKIFMYPTAVQEEVS